MSPQITRQESVRNHSKEVNGTILKNRLKNERTMSVSAACGQRRLRGCGPGNLLPWPSASWADGPAASVGRAAPICRLVPGSDRQAASHQRSGWSADGPGRLSPVYQARGIGCSSPHFCSRVQESPPAVSVGRRSLVASFNSRLSHMLASPSGKYGNPLSPCWVKTSDDQKQSLIGAALPSDVSPLFLTHFCFSFYNLCYLDESTQPGVSMTESRTQ